MADIKDGINKIKEKMTMVKKYVTLEMEITEFDVEDVITTSDIEDADEN